MQGTVQFIQATPEELENKIIDRVKVELETLKAEFQPKKPTEYLTRNEVKDLLQIDLSTIWGWTKRGKLKSYGIGARVYYKRSEIEQAIKPIEV